MVTDVSSDIDKDDPSLRAGADGLAQYGRGHYDGPAARSAPSGTRTSKADEALPEQGSG